MRCVAAQTSPRACMVVKSRTTQPSTLMPVVRPESAPVEPATKFLYTCGPAGQPRGTRTRRALRDVYLCASVCMWRGKRVVFSKRLAWPWESRHWGLHCSALSVTQDGQDTPGRCTTSGTCGVRLRIMTATFASAKALTMLGDRLPAGLRATRRCRHQEAQPCGVRHGQSLCRQGSPRAAAARPRPRIREGCTAPSLSQGISGERKKERKKDLRPLPGVRHQWSLTHAGRGLLHAAHGGLEAPWRASHAPCSTAPTSRA
jgi:hypothetical protein